MTDPHAQALWDHARGLPAKPFHYVRGDGHAAAFDIATRFGPVTRPEDAHVIAQASGRTLDVGCGAGKHVKSLNIRNIWAFGIDSELLAIKAAGTGAVMDAYRLGFGDGTFDCLTLFANGLSMGGTPDGTRTLLAELARVTRPGGRLLMTNKDVAGSPEEHDQAYQRGNLAAGRPRGQVRMRCRYGESEGPWFDWLFLAPDDLPDLCAPTAWRVGEITRFTAGVYTAALIRG